MIESCTHRTFDSLEVEDQTAVDDPRTPTKTSTDGLGIGHLGNILGVDKRADLNPWNPGVGQRVDAGVHFQMTDESAPPDEQLLAGHRVGIVGYGHIGKALARRLACVREGRCWPLSPREAPSSTAAPWRLEP